MTKWRSGNNTSDSNSNVAYHNDLIMTIKKPDFRTSFFDGTLAESIVNIK